MKTLNFENAHDIFAKFSLSNEEMIKVRGGGIDGETKPTTPPIKI